MTVSIRPPAGALKAMFRRRLDKVITIQRPVLVSGVQKYQDWQVNLPAAVVPGAGVEAATGAMDPTNVVTTSVYVEWLAGVLTSYQILFEGRPLEIVSTTNLAEADLFLLIVCREAQA